MKQLKLNFDEIFAIILFITSCIITIYFHLSEKFFNFSKNYDAYEIDEILGVIICFAIIISFYSYKKNQDLNKSNKRLFKVLEKDNLTSLDNREAFFKDIKKNDNVYAVLINIIDFKSINKILGFSKSDEFLKVFSQKLQKIVIENKSLKLYRIYGDEFAFIVDSSEDVELICQRIKDKFEEKSLIFENNDFFISLNLAYSNVSPKFLTATLAMQECKKSLDKHIVPFVKKYYNLEENKETLKMLKVIKNAISNDKIIPVYHSIIDNKTNLIYKYESLARIKQEKEELLSPYYFIELSKKFKLYPEITKNIIQKAFNDFKNCDKYFSINFSYLDIHNEQILDFFYKTLRDNIATAKRLTIEILETENIDSYEELLSFRQTINQYGCKLAIDDFGSGYSNWINILQIKPDYIKLDGSLIQNILLNDESKNLVKTIVSFAKDNGIKTIAEFVSNEELSILVKDLNIDYSQGFYYSKPELIYNINKK